MSSIASAYARLPRHEREALRVLAAHAILPNRSQFLEQLRLQDVRKGDRKRYSTTDLCPLLNQWERTSLVHFASEWQNIQCAPEVVDEVFTDTQLSPLRAFLGRLESEGMYSFRPSPAQVRIALYLDDVERVERYCRQWGSYSYREHLWPEVLGPSPSASMLARVPTERLPSAANECLIPSIEAGFPVGSGWTECFRSHREGAEEIRAWLAVAALWSERDDDVLALVGDTLHPELLAVQAMAAVLSGEAGAARTLAERAFDESRGPRRSRKPVLRGPGGPWAVLALLTGNVEQTSKARDLIEAPANRRGGSSFSGSYVELANISAALEHRRLEGEPQRGTSLDLAYWFVMRGLSQAWKLDRRPKLHDQWKSLGRDFLAHSTRGGYTRLARELHWALRAITEDEQTANLDWPSARLSSAKEPWESVLDALERASASWGAPVESTEVEAERVSWRVSVHAGSLSILATVQKRTAKGWSKGRQVEPRSLRKLEANLPAEDRRIVAQIREHRAPGTGWATVDFGEEAALALVGHPRVICAEEPVEVVEGKPEVAIRTTKGGLEIFVRPTGVRRAGVHCEQEPGRIVVHRITEGHATVARALEKRVVIPERAKARVEELAERLATGVQLRSDLDLDLSGATEAEADPRPCVLLWRAPTGLRYRVVVQPLGADGPTCRPAEGEVHVVARSGGSVRQASRDLDAERTRLDDLERACPSLVLGAPEGRHLRLSDLVDCYELLTELHAMGDGVVLRWPEGNPLVIVGQRDVSDVRVKLEATEDWLSARVGLELDEQRVADFGELARRVGEARGRFLELDGDRVLALTDRLRQKLERLGQLGLLRGDQVNIHPLVAPALEGWIDGITSPQAQGVLDETLAKMREAEKLRPRPPKTFQATLRDYQKDGYQWMCRLAHWGAGPVLCDDMGLGKTVQILAVIATLSSEGPSLIVAPTSVTHHWADEARRFVPSLNVHRLDDGEREKVIDGLGPRDLLVTTYGLLQREAELLAKKTFRIAVLDEAQAIKNASTRTARAAHTLNADLRIISTGTPIENHLGELWSLMQFANPGLLGARESFQRRFARPIGDGDRKATEALRQMVRPFLLRRTKSEVLEELPEKTELTLRVDPSAEERAFYEALRRDAQVRVEQSQGGAQRMQILAALTRLRQAACHPRLVGPEGPAESAKHEAFFALVDELRDNGHRALVFSQFVEHLSMIRGGLDARGVEYQYLDGSTPAKERRRLVQAFQQGEGDLFLISLRAGGSGLNLTAADYVIHLDPWWNPAVEAQASDRAHRIGQKRPVTVYRLIATGTVEEQILELHRTKRTTADQLLEGTDSAAPVDLEALRALLSG